MVLIMFDLNHPRVQAAADEASEQPQRQAGGPGEPLPEPPSPGVPPGEPDPRFPPPDPDPFPTPGPGPFDPGLPAPVTVGPGRLVSGKPA
jgi:hypothetical protein